MRRLPSWSKNILAIYYHFLISVQYEIKKGRRFRQAKWQMNDLQSHCKKIHL